MIAGVRIRLGMYTNSRDVARKTDIRFRIRRLQKDSSKWLKSWESNIVYDEGQCDTSATYVYGLQVSTMVWYQPAHLYNRFLDPVTTLIFVEPLYMVFGMIRQVYDC